MAFCLHKFELVSELLKRYVLRRLCHEGAADLVEADDLDPKAMSDVDFEVCPLTPFPPGEEGKDVAVA